MINVYEHTIEKVVALAVLMPIVASMGGIAGTQTLTLVIRGQALGHVSRSNLLWLLNREVAVALMNGALWATLLAIGTAFVFGDVKLGALIGTALILNMLVAAASGSVLPPLSGYPVDRRLRAGRPDDDHCCRGFTAFLALQRSSTRELPTSPAAVTAVDEKRTRYDVATAVRIVTDTDEPAIDVGEVAATVNSSTGNAISPFSIQKPDTPRE